MRIFPVQKKLMGFTLIEMLLVMVVIGTIIFASTQFLQQRAMQMRIDRTSAQMQQILNASLAFYVANGRWPTAIAGQLQPNYLPPTTTAMSNPFGHPYSIAVVTNAPAGAFGVPPPIFYVYTRIGDFFSASAISRVIAGTLPLAYTSRDTAGAPPAAGQNCTDGGVCLVVASVNIPGQNLNNARAINFAGVFKHGGCVPVPQCPIDNTGTNMRPELTVIPISVSGVNDPTPLGTTPVRAYPITSFTAYKSSVTPSDNPPPCTKSTETPACNGQPTPSGAYWRVCLQVVTEKGDVSDTNTLPNPDSWGRFATLLGITRCVVANEPRGSDFNVYSN